MLCSSDSYVIKQIPGYVHALASKSYILLVSIQHVKVLLCSMYRASRVVSVMY